MQGTATKASARLREKSKLRNEPSIPLHFDSEEEEEEVLTLDDVNEKLTVVQLQAELKKHNIKTAGRKNELIARLRGVLENESEHGSMKSSEENPNSPREQDEAENKPVNFPLVQETQAKMETPKPIDPATTTTTLLAPDQRSLRVQYLGKPVDSIKFDLNEKNAVESVTAVLRSLFPDEKVNLEPKIDVEPVYLLDEYNELHIVTLEFLKLASVAPSDKQVPMVFQVRKGPLPTALEDATVRFAVWALACACSVLQLVFVWFVLGLSPFATIAVLLRWFASLFVEARTELHWGYPASFCLSLVYVGCAALTSSFLSPSHRFGIKLSFPRLLALKSDGQKQYKRLRSMFSKRVESFKTRRIFRYSHPMPSRIGLPKALNWPWMLIKRFFFVNLLVAIRSFLLEAMVVSFVLRQTGAGHYLWVLLVPFMRHVWNALPGVAKQADVLNAVLSEPVQFECISTTDSTVTLRWQGPARIPLILTTRGYSYSVGVSRYELDTPHQGLIQFACPQSFSRHRPTLEQVVFGITTVFQLSQLHFLLSAALSVVVLVALFTETEDNGKRPGMTVCIENLAANTELNFTLVAFDELDRAGTKTKVLETRTKPKTLFRRLLLASEEVPRRGAESVSTTQGHVRYSGVVWNPKMDEKETEVFLRTLRSAYLPEPRKEKFEADFVFSDATQKNVHQVISTSFLQDLVSKPAERMHWKSDPFLIVHPAGTRHTFTQETIYSHLVVKKQTMELALASFVLITAAMHTSKYFKQTEEALYWNPVVSDTLHVVAYLWVLSNVMVLWLKEVIHAPIPQRVSSKIQLQLDLILPGHHPMVRDFFMWTVWGVFCSGVLGVYGPLSFTGLGLSGTSWMACQWSAKVIKVPSSFVLLAGLVGVLLSIK